MKRNLTVHEIEKGKSKDVPLKSKRKRPTFFQNLKDYVIEWTENTSLHGVRYLGERKRNIFEKLWWMIVFGVSLYLCTDLIIKTYDKWDNSPVIVSFAKSPTPVWQIPFPAVTICPETKSRQRAYNFTKYFHKVKTESDNMTAEEWKQYQDIALVCDSHLYNEGEPIADQTTIDFITKVAPEFEEMLWSCKWTNQNETCTTLYTPILTEEGVCYTFNMLDRDDIYKNEVFYNNDYLKVNKSSESWSLEEGYTKEAGKDTFPRRAMSAGAKAGLTMLMRAYSQDLDYICKGPVQGFKILLHHPGETPTVSSQYFRAPLNQEVIVAVKPDMMTTSDSLRDYPAHRRQCYFSTERVLRFYKNYTQKNCEVECLTNYTLNTCGCVAYHMPHNEDTKICGTGNIQCMMDAENDLLGQEVEKGIKRRTSKVSEDEENLECDCLPACTSLIYNAETSQADFNWVALFNAFKANTTEFPGVMMTRVTIFFKEMQFITSERNELYGLTDFLANCGGLLGLFIGFSFLSVVETIYFLTLRLLCNIRRHGRHYWSGSPDLVNNDAYIHKK